MTEPSLRPSPRQNVIRVVIARGKSDQADHQVFLTKSYCRMIGIEGLSEADALGKLHGLLSPALPSDLTYSLRFVSESAPPMTRSVVPTP